MVIRHKGEYSDHHQQKSSSNSKKKKKKTSNNNVKYMILYGLLIFLIGIFFILYVNQYVQMSRKNFQIENLKDKKANLKVKKAHLQLKVSQLKSLDRIEKIAKNKLAMQEPTKVNYIKLNSKTTSTQKNKQKNKDNEKEQKNKKEGIASKVLVWFDQLLKVQAGTLTD